MKELKKLTPFKYFALTNFPYIEADFDALTNYELYSKICEYINEISSVQNDVTDNFNELYSTWIETKEYIDNYFENLDVTEEINDKLDEMADDGTLTGLMRPFFEDAIESIPSVVTTWLGDNIIQETGYVIDDTLTIQNAAADSKAVGDAIDDLTDNIKTFTGNYKVKSSAFTLGYAYRTGTGDTVNVLTPNSNSSMMCTYLPCVKGDSFTISGIGGSNNYRIYCFIDSSGNIIEKGSANVTYNRTVVTAPTNAVYICINLSQSSVNPEVFIGEILIDKVDKNIEDVNEILYSLQNVMYKKIPIITEFTEHHYWNSETDTAVDTAYTGYFEFAPIDVVAGEHIYCYIFTPHSTKTEAILGVADDYTIIHKYTSTRDQYNTFDFIVPENVTKLLLSTSPSTVVSYTECYKIEPNEIENISNTFSGCKLSLLGDSFSAFDGYSTDNHDYYPNINSDVQLLNQMWWKIVCNELNMQPLVIGAWSGSCVTSGVRDDTSYCPASDPYRCEALDDGVDNPDVILIAMGVNDYSYSTENAQFVTWDETTSLGTQADLSDYINTDFERAYATMLARIQKKYPTAYIICITPFYMSRYNTSTGVNYLNAINKSIYDYAESVKRICGIMHVKVIDGTNIGFNRFNYYPTYAEDSSAKPTHPTIKGQYEIAKAIISELNTIHKLG